MNRRAAILLLVLACGGASAAPRASIELLPNAEVQGDTVLLGQVARLHSNDLDTMRMLVHLPLGRAPRAGQVAVLQNEAVGLWIRRQTGLAAADLELGGSRESHVLGSVHRAKGADIAQAAVQEVRRSLAARQSGAEVQVRIPVRDLEVSGGELRLEPRPVESSALRRHVVAWVDVWAAGAYLRSVPVSLEVLERDGPLASAAEMQVPASRGAEPLGVVRGDWATLRSAAGPVVLEMMVEILQDGRVGEKVRVRQRGATALVMARVVGPGQVELAP
jgi:flagella basal body P-ring formation protein FlgA